MISLIVAMDLNNGIGIENKLPWHIPQDMKRFKELTTNNVVVMGRKTYESIGKDLPDRKNIVLTSGTIDERSNAITLNNINGVLLFAKTYKEKGMNTFIIGGQQVYEQFIDYADRIYLTLIHREYECDTFFPNISNNQWKLVESHLHQNENVYSFLTYDRLDK